MGRYNKGQKGFGAVGVLIVVVVLGVIAFAAIHVMTAKPKGDPSAANAPLNSTTSTTSTIANEESIPLGKVASDGSFQAKLLGVTPNPVVSGDQPDPGTEYIEADFSVTSVANRNNYAFNMHYLPSILPAGDKLGDIELTPIDGTSPTSPLTFKLIPTKKVSIAGKISAQGYSLPSDGTVKTVQVYTLFEIAKGDTGQIVWQGVDNGNYHFLTK